MAAEGKADAAATMDIDDKPSPMAEKIAAEVASNRKLAIEGGRAAEAMENLLSLEKQARLAEDAKGTASVAGEIVQLCFDLKDWPLLNEHIVILSKRRAQVKQALVKIVELSMSFIEQTPDESTKEKLIITLRDVTDGKMHVEIERARLTRMLAMLKEKHGNLEEAAKIIQETQVETYGAMDRREKVDYILDQTRLCLDIKDYVRAAIIANKVNVKSFDHKEIEDLKIRYHELLIRLHGHKDDYMEMARSFHAIFLTDISQADEHLYKPALKNTVMYCLLAKQDDKQHDLLHRLVKEKRLEYMDDYKYLLKLFSTKEIIMWKALETKFRNELITLHAFTADGVAADARWNDFRSRVIEHNMRVIAGYYTNITTSRFAELLGVSEDEAETHLSDAVVSGMLFARTNRPANVISFQKAKGAVNVLDEWSSSLSQLLKHVSRSVHLIEKEQMALQARS